MKPQSLQDLEGMNQKFVTLAQAIPADKFTWRPADVPAPLLPSSSTLPVNATAFSL